MNRLLTIGEASEMLDVSISTLRRWEREGRLIPERTPGNQRRYPISLLDPSLVEPSKSDRTTVAYARVSSHDQKRDLERQVKVLEQYCGSQGWAFDVITDLGSGLNYHKRGLTRLIDDIVEGRVCRLVLTHKDRLLRFGAEIIFALCEARQVEVVILNRCDDLTFEEELAQDVLEIITVFSARLYGRRSHKNKRTMDVLRDACDAL